MGGLIANQGEIQKIGEIHIGDNVFIGANSFILPGTEIGNNCIIGAGSVVRGKIPDGSVVIGNPATIVSNVGKIANKYYEGNKAEYI